MTGSMRGWAGIALAVVAGLIGAMVARYAPGGDPRRAATEATVRDYILTHPEILPEAMKRLQTRETARAIDLKRGAIETPFQGAWAGDPHGDVTLVMFTDYSCGYCRASAPAIEQLLAEDPRLRVIWREIPILGPASETAARAALAVAGQGHYREFHRAMFAGGRVDDARIVAVEQQLGIDRARATADGSGAAVEQEIRANLALAAALGISGTPAFVIGDRMLDGAVGHDALAEAIAAARKRA